MTADYQYNILWTLYILFIVILNEIAHLVHCFRAHGVSHVDFDEKKHVILSRTTIGQFKPVTRLQ